MAYIIFGALIFWALFIGTPTEVVLVACVLFALCCIKMIRILSNGKGEYHA